MRVVWRKKVASAADVIESLLPETGWSHRTVRTLLARLVEKGALETERDGQRYLYRPTTTQKQCVREEGQSFLEKVFGGDAGELLVHFFKNEEIAPRPDRTAS